MVQNSFFFSIKEVNNFFIPNYIDIIPKQCTKISYKRTWTSLMTQQKVEMTEWLNDQRISHVAYASNFNQILFYNFITWEPSINKFHFFKGGRGVTNWGRIGDVNYGRVLFHLDDLCWTVLHIVWSWFHEFLCRFPIWILNGRC